MVAVLKHVATVALVVAVILNSAALTLRGGVILRGREPGEGGGVGGLRVVVEWVKTIRR